MSEYRIIFLNEEIVAFIKEEDWDKRVDFKECFKMKGNIYRNAIKTSNPTSMQNGWKLKGVLIAANSDIIVPKSSPSFTLLLAESENNEQSSLNS